MASMAPHTDESRSLSSTAGSAGPDEGPAGAVLARLTRGRTVLELHGEIDLAVVLATTPQLYTLTASPRPRLVADLRPVTFIDCSGLAMLVDVRSRVLAGGGSFTMVCADPRVLRLLRITGLTSLLAPVAEPEEDDEALAGPEHPEGSETAATKAAGPDPGWPHRDGPDPGRPNAEGPGTDGPGADGPGTEGPGTENKGQGTVEGRET
ncbi:STAS domain-containing protein [Streptomyces axinellae]|uniref:Anti-sigma factor antagonist n=1 Tax=Streptomyces axinellae TaxID=552788 RepID=A0ABP6CDR7_9ACTN